MHQGSMKILNNNASSAIQVYALGGLGEIGMNMLVIQHEQDAIIIDAGVMFPDEYYPGIDLILPPFLPLFKSDVKVHGIIATHGHEDHIGAIPFVQKNINLPVIGSRFTLELLKKKYLEHDLDLKQYKLHQVKNGDFYDLGPFNIEFIEVSHSIVDAFALAIDTPMGKIIHTGDFKIDESDPRSKTNIERFGQLGQEGILLMLSDSTNVEVPGKSKSESSVKDGLSSLMKECQGWFVVASFASHIPRIQQVIDLSEAHGRKVAVIGRSMVHNVHLAKDLGYLQFEDNTLVEEDEAVLLPRKKLTLLSTGTQGEPRAALAKMAYDEHRNYLLQEKDDVVMSSRFIPGNEKAIYAIINELHRTGANVHTNQGSDIHVSGHAYKEDLRLALDLIKPKHFIPIHGEYRHLLKHADLAREQGVKNTWVVENGECAHITKNDGHVERIESLEPIVVMNKQLSQMGESFCKTRRKMAYCGMIVLSLVVDQKNWMWKSDLDIQAPGVFFKEQEKDMKHKMAAYIENRYFDDLRKQKRFNAMQSIERAARKFVDLNLGRKPQVIPIILEV